MEDELCFCELISVFSDLNAHTLKGHLEMLRASRLIDVGKSGHWLTYYPTNAGEELFSTLVNECDPDLDWDPVLTNDLSALKQRLAKRNTAPCTVMPLTIPNGAHR